MNKLIAQRPEVVAACEAVLDELMDTADLEQRKQRLIAGQTRITERVEDLMNRASREVVGDFTERYSALEAEMNRVTEKLAAVEREEGERGYRERQCRLFLKALPTDGAAMEAGADRELFLALVDKVIVGERLRLILRDGSEWTV